MASVFFYRRVHLLYLSYALPIAVALALINPPFQVPDEFNHFLRAAQISSGDFYASTSPDRAQNSSGGLVFVGVQQVVVCDVFQVMPFHLDRPYDAVKARRLGVLDIPWGENKVYMAFPNTAVEPPTSYLPAAVTLFVGREAGLSVLESYYAARVATAVFSVTACALALAWITRGKLVCAGVLSLPMTLYLFSSVSHDAMVITFTAAALGFFNAYLDGAAPTKARWLLAATFLCVMLMLIAKPPYVLFVLIIMVMAFATPSRKGPLFLFAGITLALIMAYVLSVRYLGYYILGNAQPHAQVEHILRDPVDFVATLGRTIGRQYVGIYRSFIGVLGWLDTVLPDGFYTVCGTALLLFAAADFRLRDPRIRVWARFLALAAVLALPVTLLFSLDITCNAVGCPEIFGFQGRYLLPVCLMGTLCFGSDRGVPVPDGLLSWPGILRLVAAVTALVVLAISAFGACLVVLGRYYY